MGWECLSVCLPVYLSACAQPLHFPGCRDSRVRLSSLYPSLEPSCQNTRLRIFQTCTVHLGFLPVPRFSVVRLPWGFIFIFLYIPYPQLLPCYTECLAGSQDAKDCTPSCLRLRTSLSYNDPKFHITMSILCILQGPAHVSP